MIQKRIKTSFPHHLLNCRTEQQSLYIADYTQKTKKEPKRRGVELSYQPPADIECVMVENLRPIELDIVFFGQDSFKKQDGQIASQCECVLYPHENDEHSWICFIEMKYSHSSGSNEKNINKARLQLFRTQYYYRREGIFGKTNSCYLVISLPKQKPPFLNFTLTPAYLGEMKKRHSIIIYLQNAITISNEKQINVKS